MKADIANDSHIVPVLFAENSSETSQQKNKASANAWSIMPRGSPAGEIGQTQFLPSSYIKYGVDFDGDGRIDLRHSVVDVLASTANLS
jgi:hypothetical protein